MALETEQVLDMGIVEYGEYLGKVIRWYYSSEQRGRSEIVYANNGNKVPRSEGAKPIMDLPDSFPTDIDYQWYIDETLAILKQIAF